MITQHESGHLSMGRARVDKNARLPAYAQLANILRSCIARGEYPPGGQLPSEMTLAKDHGVSTMTARQAVSVLENEGLIQRIQGKGTYVRKIGVSTSSFGLDTFAETFADKKNLTVRIIRARVKKSPGREKEILGLQPQQPVIEIVRLILHNQEPFTLHHSFSRFDPASPTVESMLDTVVLTDLIFQEGCSNFKRGLLHLLPVQLDDEAAALLRLPEGTSVFKLDHLFHGFDDTPEAFGWFLVSPEKMLLLSKIGVWDE